MFFSKRDQAVGVDGFGPEAMGRVKVCPVCGTPAARRQHRCRLCGARLPEKTLYQSWLSRQRRCGSCGAPVGTADCYCSICGQRLMPFCRELQDETAARRC